MENFRSFSDEIDNLQIISGDENEIENNNKNKIMSKLEKDEKNSNLFLTKTENKISHKKNESIEYVPPNFNNENLKTIYQKSFDNFNSDKIKKPVFFNSIYTSSPKFDSIQYNNFSPVKIKFPRIVQRDLPPNINNLTRGLNKELGRICRSYGKIEGLKRFKINPVTQYHFDNNNYYAYRTAKITETKDLFRPKLKPLKVNKDPGLERMSSSIFHIRTKMAETLKEFVQESKLTLKSLK